MKSLTFIFTVLFYSIGFSQSYWENHTSFNLNGEIDFYDDKAYICNRGSLDIYDLNTGENSRLTASNSGLQGAGTSEIEISDDGTMWISAYRGGLFYFDGQDFKHYYDSGIGHKFEAVNELVAFKDKVFFRTNLSDNGMPLFDQLFFFDGIELCHLKDSLLSESEHIEFDHSGQIYSIYEGSIYQYNSDSLTFRFDIPDMGAQFNGVVSDYYIDSQNRHWVSTTDWIYAYDGVEWHRIENNNEENVFIENSDGRIHILFDKQYALVELDYTLNHSSISFDGLPHIENTQEYHLVILNIDDDGGVWYNAYSGDINPQRYRYYNGEFTPYSGNVKGGFLVQIPNDIEVDCEGNIYCFGSSTEGSLHKYDGMAWEALKLDTPLDYCGRLDVHINPHTCEKWAITSQYNCSSIFKIENDSLIEFSLPILSIDDMAFEEDGGVYFASYREGLLHISGDDIQTLYNDYNSPFKDARSCLMTSDSSLWVIGKDEDRNSVVATLKNGVWKSYTSANSPVNQLVYNLMEDSQGNIWITMGAGMIKFDRSGWAHYPLDVPPVYNIDTAVEMVEDSYGNFWISTSYAGLFYWDGYDFINYNITNSDVISNNLRDLELDQEGNLWILGSYGLSKLYTGNMLNSPAVKGKVFFDNNQDGEKQADEPWLSDQKIKIYPIEETAITNSIGAFSFFNLDVDKEYELEIQLPLGWESTTPQVVAFDLSTSNQLNGITFGVYNPESFAVPELDVTMTPIVCSEELKFWFNVSNNDLQMIHGDLNFEHDELFKSIRYLPQPDIVQDDEIEWFDMVVPGLQNRTYSTVINAPGWEIVFADTSDIDTTSLGVLGREFAFKTSFVSASTITSVDSSIFLCSYDPNDKLVESSGETQGDLFLKKDKLKYTIRFQNLGNYKAKNVVIIDSLDSNLDLESFRVVSHSHPLEVNIDRNGVVTFRFQNIDLPPESQSEAESHGFVKYEISVKNNLTTNTAILNNAEIYFDHNPAIVTNTTKSVAVDEFVTTAVDGTISSQFVSIFPNPTKDYIFIQFEEQEFEQLGVIILNIEGDLVSSRTLDSVKKSFRLDITGLSSGVYILKLFDGNSILTKKMIVTN